MPPARTSCSSTCRASSASTGRTSNSPQEHAIARWEINDLPDELGRWAAKEGVAFVDTTPRLAEVVARGEHPYFIDDVHWNATGHLIAARAIAAELAAARLFPFRAAPATNR